MIETWKNINGLNIDGYVVEGNYELSNLGEIKKDNKYLKQQKHHRGHLRVGLLCIKDKKKKNRLFRVHRLVATVFVPNPNNYPIVEHRDDNPENNKAENLKWSTQSENISHQKKPHRKIDGMIVAIRKLDSKHEYFKNIREAEKFLWDNNITKAKMPRIPIRDACDKKLGSAYGYRWYQAEEE